MSEKRTMAARSLSRAGFARRSFARLCGVALVTGAAFALAACSIDATPENTGRQSAAITFPNDKAAFDYFRAKGLSAVQAAGIVGNLDQESGVDPLAVQPGGPGRGIAQWSAGGRWDTDTNDNATWYASTKGLSVDSLQLQLDFIWYELTTFPGYGLAQLQAATTVTEATVAFEAKFEGCGTCDETKRIAYANNVLAAFGSDPVDGGAVVDSGGGIPCTVTTTGASGECITTAACAAMPGYESTPGYCPGAADIQCCTKIPGYDAGGTSDTGGTTHGGATDAATTHGSDAATGTSTSPGSDGGVVGSDAGDVDGATSAGDDTGTTPTHHPGTAMSGGCSTSSAKGSDSRTFTFAALGISVLLAARRRRSRVATATS